MYAPQVFHGTRTDVTVPESSTARTGPAGRARAGELLSGTSEAGSTSATYWSPAITFRPIPLALTARISLPRVLARDTIGASRRWRNPACSTTAANESAPSTNQTVVRKARHPASEKSWSIASLPVLLTKPVAIEP